MIKNNYKTILGWPKLNIDSFAKPNPGQVGTSGVIWDHKGNLILSYAVNLGVESSSFDEVATTFHDIQIAKQARLSNLIIEGDSRNMILMLKRMDSPCWTLQDLVSLACNLMITLGNCITIHMFQYGSKVANALANLGAFTPNLVIWDNILYISSHVCDLIHHDAKLLPIWDWVGYTACSHCYLPHFPLWKINPFKLPFHKHFNWWL